MSVINLSYLNDLSGGDSTFVIEMIELFNDKIPGYLSSLEQNMQSQNWQEVRDIAHTIKPNIDYMGIDNLKEVVRKIERNAGDRNDLEEIPQLVDTMKKVCMEAIGELKGEAEKLKS